MMRHTSRINTHQSSSRLPRPDAVCPVRADYRFSIACRARSFRMNWLLKARALIWVVMALSISVKTTILNNPSNICSINRPSKRWDQNRELRWWHPAMAKERYRHGKTFPAYTVIRQPHPGYPISHILASKLLQNFRSSSRQFSLLARLIRRRENTSWILSNCPAQQTPVNEAENNEPHRCFADQVPDYYSVHWLRNKESLATMYSVMLLFLLTQAIFTTNHKLLRHRITTKIW